MKGVGLPSWPTAMRAAEMLREETGHWPDAVAVAPGRVNVIGEHVDYCGGVVLPAAIGRRTAVAVGPGIRGRLRAWSTGGADAGGGRTALRMAFEGEVLDLLSPKPSVPMWVNYVLGAALSASEETGMLSAAGPTATSIDVAIASELPMGGGLSSSAALNVAVVLAAMCGAGEMRAHKDRVKVAMLAQRAEQASVGVPCGFMDPVASACGKAGHLVRIDCAGELPKVSYVPWPEELAFVIADSGVRHALADGQYAARRRACEAAAKTLGARTLREVHDAGDGERAVSALSGEQRDAAEHVLGEMARVAEVERAIEGIAAGKAGARGALGAAMAGSHRSLADVYRVSCPELDALVEVMGAQPGVIGARMTGGGFGGCAVAVIEAAAAGEVCRGVERMWSVKFGRRCNAMAGVPGAGAAVMTDCDEEWPW
ncbi:MAG: galactokinase [Phycisphaerales bacterium]|nr:galactokinase [Phycisphaerales bacterium]